METVKHTPGPWTITSMTKLGDLSGKVYEIGVMPKSRYHSQHVAKCWDEKEIGRNGGLTIDEAKANAKLIAAAPELLDACKEAVSTIEMLLDVIGKIQPSASISLTSIQKAIKNAQ